jgi:iron complex outermembrane recepter protein
MLDRSFWSCAFVALQSGVALSALVAPLSAYAQAATQTDSQDVIDDADAEQMDERNIVVTGTLIRGIEPVGSPVIGISREAMAATGATTANQLLQTIPQIANFNDIPLIGNGGPGSSAQLPVIRPRIRNIGAADAGAPATLVLIDGHRIVGAGLRQTTADPDVIPPGALEKVEIIPDGGSSIYGADAVAGVINFITRRRFDGVEVEGRAGFADDYYQYDAYATVGKAWDAGSAYVSYNYSMADNVMGRDRDHVRRFDYINNRSPDLTCNPGNVSVGGVTHALPARVPGTANRCDSSDLSDFLPATERHSVFGAVSQDFGDDIKLDIRGFFTRRTSIFNNGPFRTDNGTVPRSNPYFVAIGAENSQQVSFNWEPLLGARAFRDKTGLDEWGITPTVTVNLDDNWQFRWLGNYGASTTTVKSTALNNTVLQAALRGQNPDNTAQTGIQYALNPYNILATQNPAVLDRITNWQTYAANRQTLLNVRGIVDGTLFSWAGGDVHLAGGVEYLRETVAPRQGSSVVGQEDTIPVRVNARRNIKAAFGEIYIPLIGEGNRDSVGQHSLALSLSGRYDEYSDVGDTFNPKIALTLEPVDWIKIRGSWGTSFNAPSLADTIGSPDGSISALSQVFVAFLSNPDFPMDPTRGVNQPIVTVTGAFPGVKPQTAKTYSLGIDVRPPFVPGLFASLTYYNVDFKDQISLPPVFLGAGFYRQFTNLYIMYPTPPEVQKFAELYPTGLADIAGLYDPGDPQVYILLDARRRNLGRQKVSGLDFSLNYVRPTGFGSVDLAFAGTYELTRNTQAFTGAPFVDSLLRDISRFRSATTVGANVGNLRAQVTWNHNAGYDLTPQPGFNFQTKVGSFDVFNLFMRYDVKGENLFKDLAFTLNVSNVFDTDPPLLQGFSLSSSGFTNGNTLGRMFQFGVSKKF